MQYIVQHKRRRKRKSEEFVVSSIPAFELLKQRLSIVTVNGQLKVNNTYDEFLDIIRLVLRSVTVDEAWYLTEYPDIAEAVAGGEVKSARHHFIDSGYFEGRLPCPLEVDEAWYLAEYPDVAEGIERGEIQSARQHFLEHGYEEGRLPSAY
jgi:hypothetical protein